MKRIFVLTLFFLISLSNFNLAYSISPDVFIQSTVNRASKLLGEDISKEEKDKLINLTPEAYTGIASKLIDLK